MRLFITLWVGVFMFVASALAQVDNVNTLVPVLRGAHDEYGRGALVAGGLDIDGDGKGEFVFNDNELNAFVVFEAVANDTYEEVLFLEHSGKTWLDVRDLNGDGRIDFLAKEPDPISGKLVLAIYEWDGNDLDGLNPGIVEPAIFVQGASLLGILGGMPVFRLGVDQSIINVDQDPALELFTVNILPRDLTMVYAYELDISDWQHPTLALQDSFSYQPENYIHGPYFTDLNKDGFKEILFLSNARNFTYHWPVTSNNTYGVVTRKRWDASLIPSRWHNEPIIIDVNGDGVEEIYFGTYFGEIYYLEPKNTIEETFTESNLHRLRDVIPAPHDMMTLGVPGDPDRDGLVDLFFHSRDDAWLIDVEYKGGTMSDSASYEVYHTILTRFDGTAVLPDAYWSISTGYRYGGPLSMDMDNDGKAEVIISGWQDSFTEAATATPTLVIFESVVSTTQVKEPGIRPPAQHTLLPTYPNPFNASTQITFEVAKPTEVRLRVFDVTGRQVDELASGRQNAGRHHVVWEAGSHGSGIYFIVFEAGDFRQIQRAVLLK